jgi:hypothetical protein
MDNLLFDIQAKQAIKQTKSRLSKLLKFSWTLLMAFCAGAPRAPAQTAGLDINLCLEMTITGAVRAVYAIQ